MTFVNKGDYVGDAVQAMIAEGRTPEDIRNVAVNALAGMTPQAIDRGLEKVDYMLSQMTPDTQSAGTDMANTNTDPLLSILQGTGEYSPEEMANALRGQQQQADFLSLSTLAPVSNFGRQSQQNVANQTANLGRLKQAKAAQDARDLEAQKDRENRLAVARLNATNKKELEAQKAKQKAAENAAKDANKPKPKPYTGSKGQQSEYEALATDLKTLNNMIGSWKPEYNTSRTFGVPSTGMPFAGDIDLLVANKAPALASDSEKEKAEWWRMFNRLRELPDRHALFGATLTTGERASWDKATENVNLEPEQMKSSLNAMLKVMQRKFADITDFKRAARWDGDYLKGIYDTTFDDDTGFSEITMEAEKPEQYVEIKNIGGKKYGKDKNGDWYEI